MNTTYQLTGRTLRQVSKKFEPEIRNSTLWRYAKVNSRTQALRRVQVGKLTGLLETNP